MLPGMRVLGFVLTCGWVACAGEPPPPETPNRGHLVVNIEASPPPTSEPSNVVMAPATVRDPLAPPPSLTAPPSHARTRPSGLTTLVLRAGTGSASPGPSDRVKVHYTGWSVETGEVIDSSHRRGRPATFAVRGVIKGWTEALQLMVEGETRRLWIPAELAYGEKTSGRAVPAGDLVFDVELLAVTPSPQPPSRPANLTPPPGAVTSPSGLSYAWLKRGSGTKRPAPGDKVRCHYSGWTTDGKLFDSSVTRGRPATFPVTALIKGWVEGLQLMVEGDVLRLWIPAHLAYGTKPRRPGAPAGDLVFDIELIALNPSP